MGKMTMKQEYDLFNRTAPEAVANGWSFDKYLGRTGRGISQSYRLRYLDLEQKHMIAEEYKRNPPKSREQAEYERLEREINDAMGITD